MKQKGKPARLSFRLIKTGSIRIPGEYSHGVYLDALNQSQFNMLCEDINDKRFATISDPLVPDTKYRINIYSMNNKYIQNFKKECFEFMHKEGVLFYGPYALAYIWQNQRNLFPRKKINIVSLDREINSKMFSYLTIVNRKWVFDHFEYFGPHEKYCLMCLYPL